MVKCAYRNVLEASTVTLEAGAEDPYYPLYRLSDRNVGRLFKPIAFSKYAVTAGMLSQSGLGAFDAAQCVDDDTGTTGFNTDAPGAVVGSYLQVDLGAGNEQAFRKVRLYVAGTNANAVWAVQYSGDAVSWGTSGAGLDVDGALGWHELMLADAGAHRYWRLYKTNAAESGNGHTQVEFYLGGVAETITIKVDQHILISSFATSVFDAAATNTAGIAHDPDGSLWVTDSVSDKVYNIQKDGTVISSFANSVFDATASNVRDIAVDPDGTLWVVDANKDTIYHIQRDGTLIDSFLTSIFGAYTVQGLACGYDGTLWASDSTADKVFNIQKDGTLIDSFANSVFDATAAVLAGIDCDPDGSLWVCDASNTKTYHIEADGTLISSFPTSKFTPATTYLEGIARDPDGSLWIACPFSDTIYNVKDYATVQSVDRLLIPAGHNLEGVLVTVESSETDSGYAVDAEFTGTPGVISQALTGGRKQYWKVTFTSPVDVPEIPELFLSGTYEWERGPDLVTGPLEPVHDVLVERTAGGQTRFLIGGASRRQRSYSLKKCGPAQRENLLSLYSEWAGHKPFWLCDTDGQWIFGRLRAPLGLKQLEHEVYSLEFQFEEVMS